MRFILYNYRRCPFCIRVRLVFLFKGILYKKKDEKLRDWSDEFNKIFDGKKPTVPVLLYNGNPIFESLNIMEFLNNLEGDKLSSDDFFKWGDWSAGEFRDAIQKYKYGNEGGKLVKKQFEYLEEKLNLFLTGKDIALADLAVWPFVRQVLRVPSSIDMGPKLTRWYKEIEKLGEVMK